IGSGAIIFITILPHFAQIRRTYLAVRIIFWLSVCDFVVSCAYIFGVICHFAVPKWFDSGHDVQCIVQAAVTQYFEIVAILWLGIFAFALYRSVTHVTRIKARERKLEKKYELFYHFIAWVPPVIPVVILLSFQMFGPAGAW